MKKIEPLDVLRYHVNYLKKARTDWEFLSILCDDVIPLFGLVAPGFVEQCQKEIDQYEQDQKHLSEAAINELAVAFEHIKTSIPKPLMLKTDIAKHVLTIDNALIGISEFLLPDPIWVAYDEFKQLCYCLLKNGLVELVALFCTIVWVKEHRDKIDYEIIEVPYVEFFHVAPSALKYFEQGKLLMSANYTKDIKAKDPWIYWEYIYRFWWSLQWTRDDIRKKELSGVSVEDKQKSIHLLYAHHLRCDGQVIQNKKQRDYNRLNYDRYLIEQSLEQLLDHIGANSLEVQVHPSKLLYSIELIFCDADNAIIVQTEWASKLIKRYRLHSFRDEEVNHACLFAMGLFKHKHGAIDPDKVSAAGASTYLEKIGIRAIFRKLFIKESVTFKATLQTNKIYMADLSLSDVRSLLKALRKLSGHWQTTNKMLHCYTCYIQSKPEHIAPDQ